MKELEVEKLVLVDSAKRVRATLGLEDDEPHLCIFDKQGNLRICIGLSPEDNPAITLADEEAFPRAFLSAEGSKGRLSFLSDYWSKDGRKYPGLIAREV